MEGTQKRSMLRSVVRSAVERKRISGAVFYVSSDDDSTDMISAYGDMEEASQYYIASINKLFVSSIILRFNEAKVLDLNGRISKYLPEDVISGLHMHKGKEYSALLPDRSTGRWEKGNGRAGGRPGSALADG